VKWSWEAGVVNNTHIRIHSTFVILLVWIAFNYWRLTNSTAAVVYGVTFIVVIFGCVLLHEMGHALAAGLFGVRTRSITLLPIGGIASMDKMPDDPRQEILIALAGPTVNLVIGLLLYLYLKGTGNLVPSEEMGLITGNFVQRLMQVNLIIAGFNLLPAFPMDGGRVFRALLSMRLESVRATQLAAGAGQGIALFFAVLGLLYNPLLMLIAVFVWIGAAAESGQAMLKNQLSGMNIKDAMLSDYRVLSPDDHLRLAVDLTLSGSQKDFPVRSDDKTLGVLTQTDMLRGLKEAGEGQMVRDVMQRTPAEVSADTPLELVLEIMHENSLPVLVVTEQGRMIGIINQDNLVELLRIQAALQRTGG
jgi:Zn-dependent protease